jgi:hypothetical protein
MLSLLLLSLLLLLLQQQSGAQWPSSASLDAAAWFCKVWAKMICEVDDIHIV